MRANSRTTKPSQTRQAPVQTGYETYYPASIDTGSMSNPCLRYDFFQRKLSLNSEAIRYLASNVVRITADRSKYVLRIVPVHGINLHGIRVERGGDLHSPLPLMQWLRMDTNNRTLIGTLPLTPIAGGYLEAAYHDLITRRAAAIADELAAAAAQA